MEREERIERDRRRRKRNILIQAFIVLAGSVWFFLTLSKTARDENRVLNWIQLPCTIEKVKIDVDPIANPASFFWVISYGYEYEGTRYISDRYNIVNKNKHIGGKEEREIVNARKAKQNIPEPYSIGDNTVCFVNPDNPSESVLIREVKGKEVIIFRLLAPGIVFLGFLMVLLISIWNHIFYD